MNKLQRVDDNCVLYLPSGKRKSSTLWTDFSHSGNNGTVNGATLARQGYNFVSSNTAYIDSGITSNFNSITVLSWIKISSHVNAQDILGKGNYESGWNLAFGGTNYLDLRSNAFSGIDRVSNTALSNNIWYLIGFTYDLQNLYIYLNGLSDGHWNETNALTANANSFRIGMGELSGEQTFDGIIAETRLYNRALSGNEILNHYGKTRKFYGV